MALWPNSPLIAAVLLPWEAVACTVCGKDAPKTTCYSCGCHACTDPECSILVQYLGRKRRLCLDCIDMRQDESEALYNAAIKMGLVADDDATG